MNEITYIVRKSTNKARTRVIIHRYTEPGLRGRTEMSNTSERERTSWQYRRAGVTCRGHKEKRDTCRVRVECVYVWTERERTAGAMPSLRMILGGGKSWLLILK